MIPTRHKSKLPRTLSYPIGAEAISNALADAPHTESFTLSFWAQEGWSAFEFRRLIREGLPYAIFVAEHQPARKPGYIGPQSVVERGWYEQKWNLKVYPVRRELRHLAGWLLIEQGLPAVVAWLRSSRQTGWEARDHRLGLVFDPTAESITPNEFSGV